MPYRKLISLCLALLLCFSCYPVIKPSYAFADDSLSHSAYRDGLQRDLDFGSEPDNDLSGVEDGRTGEDSVSDAQEQYEADSGGGEAAAQDAGAAEAQEAEASSFSEEVATSDYGISVAAATNDDILSRLLAIYYQLNHEGTIAGTRKTWSVAASAVQIGASLYTLADITFSGNHLQQVSISDIAYSILVHLRSSLTQLSNIASRLYWSGTLKYYGSYSGGSAGLLANIFKIIADTQVYDGKIYGETSEVWNVDTLTAYIYNVLARRTLWQGNLAYIGNDTYFLTSILAHTYNKMMELGVYEGTLHGKSGTVWNLDTITSFLYNLLYETQVWDGVLAGTTGKQLWNVDTISAYTHNLLYTYLPQFVSGLDSVRSSVDGLDASGIKVNVEAGLPDSQFGGILAAVDGVKDAIMLNAAVDFVDAVLGDFSGVVDAVQASTLESIMQSAFPFCIPAIVKQLLGLLQTDPMPPSFDFEIGGEVMHVDASQMQGFADIVSWACRFMFVFALLFASRRFIFWEVAK